MMPGQFGFVRIQRRIRSLVTGLPTSTAGIPSRRHHSGPTVACRRTKPEPPPDRPHRAGRRAQVGWDACTRWGVRSVKRYGDPAAGAGFGPSTGPGVSRLGASRRPRAASWIGRRPGMLVASPARPWRSSALPLDHRTGRGTERKSEQGALNRCGRSWTWLVPFGGSGGCFGTLRMALTTGTKGESVAACSQAVSHRQGGICSRWKTQGENQ